jgi:predicted transcriptional regulator
MDQMMSAPAYVPTSAPRGRRTSVKASLRESVERHEPKKTRKNGMVVSTILFDPDLDEQLSALAFAWNTDRSALARRLINAGLARYDVAEEIRKAADRYKRAAPVESDETTDRPEDGAAISQ